jgi:sialidase-1
MGVLHSDDEGITWSAPRNLTAEVMVPLGWSTIFTGLSAGFTLDPSFGHGNRLIVCANHDSPRGRFSSSLFSDDGETWEAGAEVGPSGIANDAPALYSQKCTM